VKSSQAWDLIGNGAPDDEIAEALSDTTRSAIYPALTGAQRERSGADTVALLAGITQFVGLVGQNWTVGGRKEFIGLARQELQALPGAITLDALAEARREVNDGRHLVNWIYNRVASRTARLDAEISRFEKLTAILERTA
jgi:hypothetical protein